MHRQGNDQVRFEVGTRALAPDLEVIAPARQWGLSREDCVEYAAKWDIPLSVTKEKLVLDRREPVGQGHRVRGDRGSLE
jgi:argininosuccinate synthase